MRPTGSLSGRLSVLPKVGLGLPCGSIGVSPDTRWLGELSMRPTILGIALLAIVSAPCLAADNKLSDAETARRLAAAVRRQVARRLDDQQPESPASGRSTTRAINPHGCGGYMMIHEKPWSDFVLSLDFKIAKGCNSGVFVRTFPLQPAARQGRGLQRHRNRHRRHHRRRLSRHRRDLRPGEARRRTP